MSLSAEVYLFRFDLVWNINQQHVEEVVAGKVRLKHYLHLISLICSNSRGLGHEQEWNLLLTVINPEHLRQQLELDCE